jgi:hypothetical protein
MVALFEHLATSTQFSGFLSCHKSILIEEIVRMKCSYTLRLITERYVLFSMISFISKGF